MPQSFFFSSYCLFLITLRVFFEMSLFLRILMGYLFFIVEL